MLFKTYFDGMYLLLYNVYTNSFVYTLGGWKLKKTKNYKVRRSGNSDITTIPAEVKEYIGVQTGESISYVFERDGSVKMIKAVEEVSIDSIVDSVMDQYDKALKDLVDL